MNRSKKLLLVGMLALSCIIIQPNQAKAALHSNGGSPVQKNVNDWITEIRKMQTAGGGLGLTDTIDETNLTSQNKNLDIHMQKNTEYGAIAILSASAYGNPNKIEDGGTTTGNNTGIVMNLNKEWTASGVTDSNATSLRNASGRYKNIYTIENTARIGDATIEMNGWHGSGASTWIRGNTFEPNTNVRSSCFARSYVGSIFSYNGEAGVNDASSRGGGNYTCEYVTRAIVVVGSGV